ncbi:NUDIX domain-containing protein [Halomonas icarae]|uniref:Nudix hydrolase domain-containing protein n=1 Tax=Halomonas icarae TaxID=2691040 RepID=A0A7X5ALX6_9GAMM|nr:NUDIX hydrolase [Halomonas icarae]MDR5903469.1 NUDIX hydrolase [Halomonas icarae]NAW13231.1 hypothetical protein [Halomonas icarae]
MSHPERAQRVRPAATLALVRDGAEGLEVLLLQRTWQAAFLPGYHVFPGGAVDMGDTELRALVRGRDDAEISQGKTCLVEPDSPAYAEVRRLDPQRHASANAEIVPGRAVSLVPGVTRVTARDTGSVSRRRPAPSRCCTPRGTPPTISAICWRSSDCSSPAIRSCRVPPW